MWGGVVGSGGELDEFEIEFERDKLGKSCVGEGGVGVVP